MTRCEVYNSLLAHVVVVVVVFKGVYISSYNNIDAVASVRSSKGEIKIFQAEIMVPSPALSAEWFSNNLQSIISLSEGGDNTESAEKKR